jgi:hypothetical protein
VCGARPGKVRTFVLSDVEADSTAGELLTVELDSLAQRFRIFEIDVGDTARAVGFPVPGHADGALPGQVAASLLLQQSHKQMNKSRKLIDQN